MIQLIYVGPYPEISERPISGATDFYVLFIGLEAVDSENSNIPAD